ncbi:MAG: hypothetical protein AB1638_08380 [Nitrospirota bacterium]
MNNIFMFLCEPRAHIDSREKGESSGELYKKTYIHLRTLDSRVLILLGT